MKVLESGEYERLKLAVHTVMLVGSVVCGSYNLAAWLQRRERHNLVNAGVYTALAVLEWTHVQHHRS